MGAERRALHERRPTTAERIENRLARLEVPGEEDLHELRNKLAQVRMETVDVLCPLAFRKIGFRPRQLRIQVSCLEPFVELPLGRHVVIVNSSSGRTTGRS